MLEVKWNNCFANHQSESTLNSVLRTLCLKMNFVQILLTDLSTEFLNTFALTRCWILMIRFIQMNSCGLLTFVAKNKIASCVQVRMMSQQGWSEKHLLSLFFNLSPLRNNLFAVLDSNPTHSPNIHPHTGCSTGNQSGISVGSKPVTCSEQSDSYPQVR